MDATLAILREANKLPCKEDQVAISGHVLGVSDCYDSNEFHTAVRSVLSSSDMNDETTRIYKEAIVIRLIHFHDLCVLPPQWDNEVHESKDFDDVFYNNVNFSHQIECNQYRFFQNERIVSRNCKIMAVVQTGKPKTNVQREKDGEGKNNEINYHTNAALH